MAEKIRSTRGNIPQLTSFQLKYWSVFETLPCLWNFWLHLGKKCIFQQFLSLMQPRPYKVALPNRRCITKSWQISCRNVYVFRKLNSINPIAHNLSFCEPKSSSPFVKLNFTNTHFTKRMLDFDSTKLRLWLIGLMEFNFLKTKTYLHEICQLSMIHLRFGTATL